jgi:16S rRNA G966 N2-methylase RsmD
LPENAYDIAFADPPYTSKMLERIIESWTKVKFARILVCEHARDFKVAIHGKRRVFDDTAVTFLGS